MSDENLRFWQKVRSCCSRIDPAVAGSLQLRDQAIRDKIESYLNQKGDGSAPMDLDKLDKRLAAVEKAGKKGKKGDKDKKIEAAPRVSQ